MVKVSFRMIPFRQRTGSHIPIRPGVLVRYGKHTDERQWKQTTVGGLKAKEGMDRKEESRVKVLRFQGRG